jgi:peptidoglycan/LPS O-acetylase OafA/YrhL
MPKTERMQGGMLEKCKCAAIMAGGAVLIALALLFAIAFLTAKGTIPMERREYYVMLSVFLGTSTAALLRCAKEGRGVLKTAGLAFVMYAVLLVLLNLFADTSPVFTSQYLKNMLCAAAGLLFGCAVFAFRKPKQIRKQKRYNR